MSDELPEGWATTELGCVADLISGVGFPLEHQRRMDRPYPFFKVGNLGDVGSGTSLTRSEHTVDEALAAKLGARILPPGSTVFAKIGMAIRLNRRRLLGVPACVDNNMMAAVPGGAIDGHFLVRFLETVDLMPLTQSTTVPSLRKSDLAAIVLQLPPLIEQRRIAAKVEELLAEVNRAKARLTKVEAILTRFRHSVLAAACSGRLTNLDVDEEPVPSAWNWRTIDEIAVPGGIFDGARDHGSGTHVAQNLRTADYTTSGVRVVRLENLGHLDFIEDKRTYVSHAKYAGLKQNTVVQGDILVGSFVDQWVRVCMLPALDTPAITKADCFCVRPRTELVSAEYLALQLGCDRTHGALLEEVHGATRPRISTKQLRAIRIPLCGMAEQIEIVRRVRELFAIGDENRRRVQKALYAVETLPQAILSKAFSGELVPTEAELARLEGRDYEPASVLLEQTKSTTATETIKMKKRSTKRQQGASGSPPRGGRR